MWQRIQTIFLLLSALAGCVFLFLPLAELGNDVLYTKNDVPSTSVAIAIILLSLFTITQFKNRKLQMRICWANIFLSIALLLAAIFAANAFSEYTHFEFAAGVPVLILIAQFFAIRNIRKDENLIKSMDRMR